LLSWQSNQSSDAARSRSLQLPRERQGSHRMNNIFTIIGVVVVVLFILGYLGLR
jgi:hypothetical protein